jgi:UDP-2,3-diacylglucosamine pyrophosphatase LpxH
VADIRWVCLSDLHLGAENSVLSHIPDGDLSVDPATPSAVLEQLVACLRQLISTNAAGALPTLVLHGDILEFALAEDNVAAMTFASFLKLAFSSAPIFNDTIYYVPGNHDHHLWETAREQQFANYVGGLGSNERIEAPVHTTPLFESLECAAPEAALINALLQRAGKSDLRCYPNLGLESADKRRVVVIHHGHFTEPLYRLISGMKVKLFPVQPPGDSVEDWETSNFAWIDFFWSTLGRSGTAGSDVGLIYDMLQDDAAIQVLADNLALYSLTKFQRLRHLRGVLLFVLKFVARRSVPRFAARERGVTDRAIGDATAAGMVEYLAGPLRTQLESERPGATREDVTFLFGHTHKPFERLEQVPEYERPISVVNSGGWVVDTSTMSRFQGGAVALIDQDCAVASLRMYNQGQYQVAIAESGSEADRAFQTFLRNRVDFDAAPWTNFASAVEQAVDNLHGLLPKFIARGVYLAGGGPAHANRQPHPSRALGNRAPNSGP